MPGPIHHLALPVDDLAAARRFYEDVLGCRIGRVREEWFDAWFFGMQVTLGRRPDEVGRSDEQGMRHFGVVLDDAREFTALVDRLRGHDVVWLTAPSYNESPELSGKTGCKLADPAGNVIEIKHYANPAEYLGEDGDRSS